MKKLIVALIIFLMIIGGVVVLLNNTTVVSDVAKYIESVLETPDEEYTSNFEINRLGIKNNMYYYNTLNDAQKSIYTSIANGVKDLNDSIKLKKYEYIDSDTTMKDVEIALHRFLYDHPEVFYLEDKYTVSTKSSIAGTQVFVNFKYQYSSLLEIDDNIKILEEKINSIIAEAQIEDGKDFENELKLHDVLLNKVKYHEYEDISQIPNKYHSIYGTLTENEAVCDGITKTLQILLDKAGIESIVVSGKLNGTSHAWNMVKLEDEWYNLDATSNNSVKTENKVVVHSYFNITTDNIKNTHTITNEEIIPTATSDKYNYYVYCGKNIAQGENFNTRLTDIISNNQDTKLVEYRVNGIDDVPEKTVEVLRKNKFTDYLESKSTKFVYYNVLDTYIILKK